MEDFKTILQNTVNNLHDFIRLNQQREKIIRINNERVWGAIALSSPSTLFYHLPNEIKMEILAYVWNGTGKKRNKHAKQLNANLLESANAVYAAHLKPKRS